MCFEKKKNLFKIIPRYIFGKIKHENSGPTIMETTVGNVEKRVDLKYRPYIRRFDDITYFSWQWRVEHSFHAKKYSKYNTTTTTMTIFVSIRAEFYDR